jgi:hypothetical protein
MPISSGAAPARASVRHSLPSGRCIATFAPDRLRRDRGESGCTDHAGRGIENRPGGARNCSKSDVLLYLVENGPGRSELELSEAIYGAPGYPQRLQQDLLRLVSSGGIERRGEGSPADPYIYHPIRSRRPV